MFDAIPDPVRARALAEPDRPALAGDASLGYGALDEAARRFAQGLRAAGVEPGHPVALALKGVPETAVALLGTWRAGALAAPLRPDRPRPDLEQRLAALGSPLLVAETATLQGLKARPFKALVATSGDRVPVPDWAFERPATAVFTSGSTGEPKAAVHTLGNHVWSARGVSEALAFGPRDRWLLALPLDHVGGLSILVRTWLAGGTAIVAPPGGNLAEVLKTERVTHASLVTTQLHRLLQGPLQPLPALKAILLGGSPVPPDLLRRALKRGLPVRPSYGMTEMTATVAVAPEDDPAGPYATLPHRTVHIGPEGEIVASGRTRFAGYLKAPPEPPSGTPGPLVLDTPFDAGGGFPTGDLGALEGDRLTVTGRADRRFVSGGENVQPEALERALRALPGVARVAVVPVADAEFGHRPAAFLAMHRAALPTLQSLRDALRDTLPAPLLPAAVLPLPDPPKGALKPDLTRLQQLAEAAYRDRP